MANRTLFKTGVCGAGVAALCCFTPLLVVLLPAVGLGAWLAWADYVLWPLLAVSLGVMGYAWWANRACAKHGCSTRDGEINP